jgi:hypothetical protein
MKISLITEVLKSIINTSDSAWMRVMERERELVTNTSLVKWLKGSKQSLRIMPAHFGSRLQAPDRLMKNPFTPPFPFFNLHVKAKYLFMSWTILEQQTETASADKRGQQGVDFPKSGRGQPCFYAWVALSGLTEPSNNIGNPMQASSSDPIESLHLCSGTDFQ